MSINFIRQVYDYTLTFQREVRPLPYIIYLSPHPPQVELVWKRRWGLGTILFVFNRYTPFIESVISLSSETVTATYQTQPKVHPSQVFLSQSAGLCFPLVSITNLLLIHDRCAGNLPPSSHVSTERDVVPDVRHRLVSFFTGFIILGLLTSESILMLRTYAIWDRSRKALYVLLTTGAVRTSFQTGGIVHLILFFSF